MQSIDTIDPNLINGKRVLVRADLDVDTSMKEDAYRLQTLIPTLQYLLTQNAKIIILGHKGRPDGKPTPEFTMAPIAQEVQKLLGVEVKFVDQVLGPEVERAVLSLKSGEVMMLENLRFVPGEEANDPEFAKFFAQIGEFYVNESFSVSHRKHASIVGIPALLPHAAGLRLTQEIASLSKTFDDPKKPVIITISGLKEDKLSYVEKFAEIADKILIGGRLPEYLEQAQNSTLKTQCEQKLVIAHLLPDKEDLTINSMEAFEKEIAAAGTIVLSGPFGKFEDEGHRQGTERVFNAIVNSSAYKVAGGGDTEKALSFFGLREKFDWVSVGGGAMLDFLANKTLPGIEALQ